MDVLDNLNHSMCVDLFGKQELLEMIHELEWNQDFKCFWIPQTKIYFHTDKHFKVVQTIQEYLFQNLILYTL